MSLIVDEHREYLEDGVRLEAYRAALGELVRPGDVVVDVGAGTGVLGLLACRAGAARVYAIEVSGMVDIAKRVAAANGLADRIVHVNELSTRATLPEPADGLVTDQIGHFGFEAGLFELMADSRRFLKPGGWTVPHAIELHVAPISDPEVAARIDFWSRPHAGLDFSPAHDWAENTGYPKHLDPAQLLGPPAMASRVACARMSAARIKSAVSLTIDRAGTLDAIGGWFLADLSHGVELTNAPGASRRLTRRNVVLPIRPQAVVPGDRVDLQLQVLPADLIVSWKGTIQTARGEHAFSHSTLSGMLLTRDDLRRLEPGTAPRLTERGRARLTILELCDGATPLAAIEREVFTRYPTLFRSATDASVFVAEVVSRYSA